MTYKNLWDIPNMQLEKTQQSNENLRMKRSDLRIHLNNLEKEEQIELQESTIIIMKIRTKGNKADQKKTKQNKQKPQQRSLFLQRTNGKHFKFCGPYVTTTRLCHCNAKQAQSLQNEWTQLCFNKTAFTKQVMGYI